MAKPRLLDEVRNVLRVTHYSIRTEEAYVQWIKRFIYFHNKKHPADMGEAEISALLAIIFGYRYIKNKGENIVVVAGVAVAFIMLMLNIAFLLSFKVWQSIGF